MKKYIFITVLGFLFISCSRTNETRNLEKFNKVHIVGSGDIIKKETQFFNTEIEQFQHFLGEIN